MFTKETKAERLWKVFTTVNEMLRDRGYDNLVAGKSIRNYEDFLNLHVSDNDLIDKQSMNFVCQNSKNGKLMMVYFSNEESIGVTPILELYDKLESSRIPHCILIYPNSISSQAKKAKRPKVSIETFSENDLIINITKHVLMPKHYVLDNDEKAQFYKESRLADSQLPRILTTDPIAKYYGMKRGDVVRIIRKSETAGLYVTYRVCN